MRLPDVTGGAKLTLLSAADAAELDQLTLRCADFMRLAEGREPQPHDGREILTVAPPNFPMADKFVLGVWSAADLIGVADVLRGYPTADIWWIGLLLLVPEARGGGFGHAIVESLAAWSAGEGAVSLQLGVVSQNESALRFWRRHGFDHIRTAERQHGRLRNRVLVMERRLR